MTTELEFTKLEDPFHNSSLFSLLPKTLTNRSGSGRLDTAEHLFESLVARGSPKVMQQAQIISNSVSAIDSLYKEGETIDASCKPHGQERRPALGRRRARFSIKPDGPSYSVPDRNINSNIDDIDDPDEYFKAFEEREEAEKELQKLRGGVLIDAAQQDQVTKTRKRRPGLLGKRASYKHHISKDDAMAETLAKIEDKHHEVSNHSSSLINNELVDGTMSETDNTHSNPEEPQLEDSFAEKENNELDHLMSSYKDLDEGEDEDYMREIFNLKSIDVGKINLPTLPNCTLSTMAELPDKLPQTIRSPLVSISTFLKKQLSITNLQKDTHSFLEENAADSSDSSASKSAERSPAVEPDRVIDPSRNSHPPLDKNCSPKSTGARNNKHSILDHGELQGVNIQHGTLAFEMSDSGVRSHDSQPKTHEVLEDSSHLLGETTKDDSNANIKDSNVPHANGCLYADVDANIQMPDARISEGELCPADTNQHCENQHGLSNNRTKELSVVPSSNEARRQKAPKRAVNKRRYSRRLNAAGNSHSPEAMDGKNQPSENQLVLPDTNYEHQVASPTLSNELGTQEAPNRAVNKRKYVRKQNVAGNSHPPEAMDGSDQPSENQHVSPGTNSEHQVAFQTVSNELGTQKAPLHPRKRKVNNKRHSLAGAGTLWKDGTRRSARHKFRPLEYWRGERLLFGRIHDSLATVIGVKYASPGKENLKVESYVSDEFADLLSLAAKG